VVLLGVVRVLVVVLVGWGVVLAAVAVWVVVMMVVVMDLLTGLVVSISILGEVAKVLLVWAWRV
jgi:hypothetical protein